MLNIITNIINEVQYNNLITAGNVSEIAEKGTDIVKVTATDEDLG